MTRISIAGEESIVRRGSLSQRGAILISFRTAVRMREPHLIQLN